MKFTIVAVWILLGSLVFGAAWEQSTSFHNVKAVVSSDKELGEGNNALSLTLSQQNAPIDNAVVEIKALMPAMPGMPAMESKVTAKGEGRGVYKAPVELDMRGTWQLHIYVMTKEGKKYHLKTSVSF